MFDLRSCPGLVYWSVSGSLLIPSERRELFFVVRGIMLTWALAVTTFLNAAAGMMFGER